MSTHDVLADAALTGVTGASPASDRLRRYHAARWDEPTVMELGAPAAVAC
jgi:hypothetical protein